MLLQVHHPPTMADIEAIPSGFESLSCTQKLQERLDAAVAQPWNQKCSDCTENNPTWASILHPPFEGAKPLVALCCFQCCNHHVKLERNTCIVRSPKMAADCK